ncbi:Lsr2 family DNA-binding protein [Streptomyces olivochromogenes]|uniref:Lsr2 DNA-binding domain-containing protein n=1 Tax=Streptomyces olivochromogenes TaxID=1963 RepID=A0A250VKM9_STROL|nr:histone-like nucleoid-structuring protein Lsr2 [Streptomyces olivochromogenes]KUN42278.1 hypothetical protein AQJ27_37205 [Streptomyces olivochromogenes]GAX54735.1 hypothetical protein SO3561_06288 [Streptomyces olivochromogenes]
MAQKPVVVTEAEWEKDKENIQRVETPLPGFPDAQPLVTYFKVEYVDDFTEKAAPGGTESVPLLVPVEKERETTELDAEGDTVLNGDGTAKIVTEKYWDFEARELDLSDASIKKLVTALKPFYDKSRERVVSATPRVTASTSGGSGHDLNAIRAWARGAGHEVNDKGRVANRIIDLYYTNNPGVKRPDAS